MNLVVIEGSRAYRYEGSRRIEAADIAWEEQTVAQFKAMIEDFRVHGLPDAPPPPIIQPADIVFIRMGSELVLRRPLEGLSNEELEILWNSDLGPGDMVGRFRIEDVHAEMTRRGIKAIRS